VDVPHSGRLTIENVVSLIRSAPRRYGAADRAMIRTVRAVGSGRQYNLGTVLHVGVPSLGKVPDEIRLAGGSVVLLSREVDVGTITSVRALTRMLSEWPQLPPDEGGAWQRELHAGRSWSEPEEKMPPYWSLDFPRADVSSYPTVPIPSEPLYDPVTGFFADRLAVAAARWLQVPGTAVWEANAKTMLLLYDSRGYFQNVIADSTRIEISVRALRKKKLTCLAKLYDYRGGLVEQRQPVRNGRALFESDHPVQSFDLYLFDDGNGQFYDRYSSQRWVPPELRGRRSHRTDFTPSQRALIDDAETGEGLEIEFKEFIPPTGEEGKYRQLAETVCAFANARGGRLYIGVSDKGEIKGCEQGLRRCYEKTLGRDPETLRTEYARQLRKNVREGLDPPIEPAFEWISNGPHYVLCILVPRGNDGPYQVIETGEFIIRSNATSRHMRAAELDQAFNRKRQRFGR
jgi:Putative DNA-binding domain